MTVNTLSVPESNDVQTWFHIIKEQIQTACLYTELRSDNVSTETGSLLVESLSQDPDIERLNLRFSYNSFIKVLNIVIRPMQVQDAHQKWIDEERIRMTLSGFLNGPETFASKWAVGTSIDHFTGQYTGSRKEPDMVICYNSVQMPSIAIESGWSEGVPRLHNDMRLWLVGGQPEVQLVIVLCWAKISGRAPVQQVKGNFEVWERDAGGTPYPKQDGVIFPTPANAATQIIPITRAQLFGPAHVFAGRNGMDVWNLCVDILRTWARPAIINMGYQPA